MELRWGIVRDGRWLTSEVGSDHYRLVCDPQRALLWPTRAGAQHWLDEMAALFDMGSSHVESVAAEGC